MTQSLAPDIYYSKSVSDGAGRWKYVGSGGETRDWEVSLWQKTFPTITSVKLSVGFDFHPLSKKKLSTVRNILDDAGTYIIINIPLISFFLKKMGMGYLIKCKYFILTEIWKDVLSFSIKKWKIKTTLERWVSELSHLFSLPDPAVDLSLLKKTKTQTTFMDLDVCETICFCHLQIYF